MVLSQHSPGVAVKINNKPQNGQSPDQDFNPKHTTYEGMPPTQLLDRQNQNGSKGKRYQVMTDRLMSYSTMLFTQQEE